MSFLKVVGRTLLLYACAILMGALYRVLHDQGSGFMVIMLLGWLLCAVVVWRFVVVPTWRWFWPRTPEQKLDTARHCVVCERANPVYVGLVLKELERRYAMPALPAQERVSPRRSP